MFTIIYEKATGIMQNIIAGENDREEMLKALPIEFDICYVETLPEYNMYRQYVKVEDGKLVVYDLELSPEKEKEVTRTEIIIEINNYKRLLEQSDYKAMKFLDGSLSEEEYYPIREDRKYWRKKINELEEELNRIGF